MSRFLRNAREILDVATAAAGEDCDLALLLDRDGAIRIVSAPGWGLDGLRASYGTDAAYRVRRVGTRVRVEGACSAGRCVLDSPRRSGASVPLLSHLADRPEYRVRPRLPAAGAEFSHDSPPAPDEYS